MNNLSESQVLPLIVSQLIAYGYSAVAKQVADATGAETDMLPSSKLSEYLFYGKEQAENDGSDSEFSDKDSDDEPMKEDKQETEDTSDPSGLSFDDSSPTPKPTPEYTQMYYTQHKGPCLTAVFSPDGKLAATGSHDASLKVLDVHKMKHRTGDVGDKPVIRTLYDHIAPVSDISFHPNGNVLASCSEDQSIKLFDLSRHGVKRAFRYLKDAQAVNSISFHPSGDFILSGTTDANVRIYDVKTFQCYTNKSSNVHRGGITQIRYSNTGRLFATSSMDGSVRIWDGVNSQCVRAIDRAHGGAPVSSVRVTKNEKYLLSAGGDATLKMWEISSGKMPTMTYNEDYVMIGDEGSTDVLCWDTRTGALLKRLPGQNNNVRCVVASPIDDAYLTCSATGILLFTRDYRHLQSDKYDCALDLMRRLPPQNVEENLSKLLDIVDADLGDDLLSAIDQPLKVRRCKQTGKDYLACDYNRDGDSSPWSNEFDPELPDGATPNATLRKLEVHANEAFDTYREMYYEGGVSSVYTFEIEDKFAVVVLIKKVGEGARRMKGAWDSIHVFEVQERGRNAHYKLTSTVMLYMITNKPELGHFNLSGSLTRQAEQDYPVDDQSAHIVNIGRMVEDMEIKMRNALQEVYFGKTKDIVNDLRSVGSLKEGKEQADIQRELVGKLMLRGGQ